MVALHRALADVPGGGGSRGLSHPADEYTCKHTRTRVRSLTERIIVTACPRHQYDVLRPHPLQTPDRCCRTTTPATQNSEVSSSVDPLPTPATPHSVDKMVSSAG